jgi:hypothetical protein
MWFAKAEAQAHNVLGDGAQDLQVESSVTGTACRQQQKLLTCVVCCDQGFVCQTGVHLAKGKGWYNRLQNLRGYIENHEANNYPMTKCVYTDLEP